MNTFQSNPSESHDHYAENIPKSIYKLEVKIYPTQITNAIIPTSWSPNLWNPSQNKTDSNWHSHLEFVFLLDSGSPISVPSLSTYTMIIRRLKVCSQDQQDTSKTMTITNKSEVPFKQSLPVKCFSSIGTKSRNFVILFAVSQNANPWKIQSNF